eukprot:g2843.t1
MVQLDVGIQFAKVHRTITSLSKVFVNTRKEWRDMATGPHSFKAVRARYAERLHRVREIIANRQKERGLPGLVTKEDVVNEMEKMATRIIQNSRDRHRMSIFFHAWNRSCLKQYHWNRKKAERVRFVYLVGRSFAAWRLFASRSAQGLPMSGSSAPIRCFDGAHNANRIAQHWRRAMLRKHLRGWRRYAHPRQVVRRKVLTLSALRARRAVEGWKSAARAQKRVKRSVVNEWREYSTLLVQVPFRAWFVWAHERKQRKQTQRAVVKSFLRRRRYYRKLKIFKLWKHLSIYGKVEGLKSRVELIKALETQNAFASSLEETVESLENELLEVQGSFKTLQETTKDDLAKATELREQLQERDFAIHRAEQEVAKLQATLDAVQMVYPHTVTKLKVFANEVAEKNSNSDADLRQLVRLRVKEKLRSSGNAAGHDQRSSRASSRRRRNSLVTPKSRAHSRRQTTPMNMLLGSPLSSPVGRKSPVSPANRAIPKGLFPIETDVGSGFGSVSPTSFAESSSSPLPSPTKSASAVVPVEAASANDVMMLHRCKIALLKAKLIEPESDDEASDNENEEGDDHAMDPLALLRFIATGDVPSETFVNETGDSFADFLGSVALEYPMRHALNKSSPQSIQARVAMQRIRRSDRTDKCGSGDEDDKRPGGVYAPKL